MRCPLGFLVLQPTMCARAPCDVCMRNYGDQIVADIERLGARAVKADLEHNLRMRMGMVGALIGVTAMSLTKGEHV